MTGADALARFQRISWKGGRLRLLVRRVACGLALTALGVQVPVNATPAGASGPLRFAFSIQNFRDVNLSDARAGIKIWAETLAADQNIPIDPTLEFLEGTAAIQDALLGRRGDMISMTAVEFWELRRVVAFYPTAIYAPTHGKIMERYVLLVRRDNPAARLADLRGCTVGLFDGPYGNLCAVWAETLLLDQHLGRADSFWGTITTPTKVTQAVLPVFFSNSAACVVTSEGFRTMCALNPQLDRQLRVLAESPALVPSICCFRADYDSPYRDKFLAGMGRVAECAAGRQTLALVHSDGLVARPLSDMDAACALLDRHARLLAVVEAAAGTTAPAPPPATGERTP